MRRGSAHGPLAYFLTWTTYGTWLPGDERGWVAKPGQFRAPDQKRQRESRQRMTEPALTFDAEQCRLIERTIAEHCRIRHWHLHAVTCRTNHAHVVVTATDHGPDTVMNQFKAWCTRRLKELARRRCPNKPEAPAKDAESPLTGTASAENKDRALAKRIGCRVRQNWWTQRGSKRWLNDAGSLQAAIRYVLEGQEIPHV